MTETTRPTMNFRWMQKIKYSSNGSKTLLEPVLQQMHETGLGQKWIDVPYFFEREHVEERANEQP